MNRVIVPKYAKTAAKIAIAKRQAFPPSKKPGLTKKQAQNLKITSGVERAKQIIRSRSIPVKDAKRVGAFYDRFKNCRTKRCEVAIGLWGGRRFGRKMASRF